MNAEHTDDHQTDGDRTDTEFERLAAQIGARPPLAASDMERLLGSARADGVGQAELVDGLLDLAVAGALSPHEGLDGFDVWDLFQEASIAIATAVTEYVAQDGPAARLRDYVARVVTLHLDYVKEQAVATQGADAAFARDATDFELTTFALRRQLNRDPTKVEIGTALSWEPERVELVADLVTTARARADAEVAPFLDDLPPDRMT